MDIARLKQLAGIGENPHFISMPNPRQEFARRHHEKMKLSMNESKPQKLELKKLAYATGDLAPVLSKDNVEYHYNVLSNGYINRYNNGEGDADLKVSIKEDHATIKVSNEVKASYEGVYPIQATVKGKRIFKLFLTDPKNQNIIYDTLTVSMVELLTEEEITKDIIADLRHCHVYTAPLFDKYLRV